MPLNIPLIYGSIRDGRKSEAAAKFIHAELLKLGVESPYVTPEIYHKATSIEKAAPEPWKSIAEKADAFIIVSPEYNHGYPGALKELLDSLYVEYHRKPVGICGAAGFLGGGRVVEQLRQVVIELHMVPIREALYFPLVWEMFNEDGSIKDAKVQEPRLAAFFQELLWYAEVLKEARANRPF